MNYDTTIKGALLIVSGSTASKLAEGEHSRFVQRIGAAIRTTRLCRGLSLVRLAKECGLPKSTLADVEAGRSDLRVSALATIEEALGVDPGWIMRTIR